MANFWEDAQKLFIWCWRIFISIPAVFILIEAIKMIISGQSMDFITRIEYYSSVIFIVIFVLGIIVLSVSHALKRWGRNKEKTQLAQKYPPNPMANAHAFMNININSNDFVNKDAKQTEVFFDGVLNVIRESSKSEKRQSATNTKPKETKRKRRTSH